MKNAKNFKLIIAIVTGIIVIIIGTIIFLISSKNDKTTPLIANSPSESPLVHDEIEPGLYQPESNAKNNSDKAKPNSETSITQPITSKVFAPTIQSPSSEMQIKTYQSESSMIKSSSINEQTFSEIRDNIIKPAVDSFNGEIDIYFEILDHDMIFATQNAPMYPASLAKLFLMGTIFQAIEDGIIEYNENIAYDLQMMITVSDNAAFNRLFYLLQDTVPEINMFDFVDDFCIQNNFSQTTIHALIFIDGNERFIYPTDHIFESSAEDVGHFLSMVYRGELVNQEASQKMYDLLLNQERTWKIPTLLPDKAITANKTGEKDSFSHDAAIIKSPNCDYVLAVLSNSADPYQADLFMQNLSLEIYNYLNP
ncbi:MAG TPA: serine hydrolase [Clostridiaceae bacterium]|jgi:beta-lactamase class A|nr:serine hydrolase [Clostridiaceae bacterium]